MGDASVRRCLSPSCIRSAFALWPSTTTFRDPWLVAVFRNRTHVSSSSSIRAHRHGDGSGGVIHGNPGRGPLRRCVLVIGIVHRVIIVVRIRVGGFSMRSTQMVIHGLQWRLGVLCWYGGFGLTKLVQRWRGWKHAFVRVRTGGLWQRRWCCRVGVVCAGVGQGGGHGHGRGVGASCGDVLSYRRLSHKGQ